MSETLRLRTILVSTENERLRSMLVAGFNEQGDLVLDGYDIGTFVQEVWGDSDYEYTLTVKLAQLPQLTSALAVARGENEPAKADCEAWLIATFKSLFAPDATPLRFRNDSEFKKWLDERSIPSEFDSWP